MKISIIYFFRFSDAFFFAKNEIFFCFVCVAVFAMSLGPSACNSSSQFAEKGTEGNWCEKNCCNLCANKGKQKKKKTFVNKDQFAAIFLRFNRQLF